MAPGDETFPWERCREVLGAVPDPANVPLEPKGRFFEAPGRRIWPPLWLPPGPGCRHLADYLDLLPERPGRHLVLLLQAGAASLGMFAGGEELATKSFKRYVVRGRGRGQPKHLESKGKSRYGSRLRLQNHQKLLEETNERLAAWWDEFGPAHEVYFNGPPRLLADLFAVKPPPPFEREPKPRRIPRDLPRPTTDVLQRAYKALGYGRIEPFGTEPEKAG